MQIDIRPAASWIGLAILGIILVIAGFQGSAGRLLAVVFAPDQLEVWDGTQATNTSTTDTSTTTTAV